MVVVGPRRRPGARALPRRGRTRPVARPCSCPPPGRRARGPGRAPAAAADRLVAALDGLVLIGGGDVDAARYGEDPDPRNGGPAPRATSSSWACSRPALARDLPVLAVCRGMQVLNVGLGGDLVQQLPDRLGHRRAPAPSRRVRPGRRGHRGGDRGPPTARGPDRGPCSHHQAVDRLGAGLVVTARSEDGVVEAVELPGHRFVVGVQWHPEENGDLRLFEALVDAAHGRAPSRGSTADSTDARSTA